MLQCLPPSYSREDVVALLDEHGFARQYDFLYVPGDFGTGQSFGYAFVNLISAEIAGRCWQSLQGYEAWKSPFPKKCCVCWAATQGLEANIERYRNSNMMHPSVRESIKPLLFDASGGRLPFPAPTARLVVPTCRRRRPGMQTLQANDPGAASSSTLEADSVEGGE